MVNIARLEQMVRAKDPTAVFPLVRAYARLGKGAGLGKILGQGCGLEGVFISGKRLCFGGYGSSLNFLEVMEQRSDYNIEVRLLGVVVPLTWSTERAKNVGLDVAERALNCMGLQDLGDYKLSLDAIRVLIEDARQELRKKRDLVGDQKEVFRATFESSEVHATGIRSEIHIWQAVWSAYWAVTGAYTRAARSALEASHARGTRFVDDDGPSQSSIMVFSRDAMNAEILWQGARILHYLAGGMPGGLLHEQREECSGPLGLSVPGRLRPRRRRQLLPGE